MLIDLAHGWRLGSRESVLSSKLMGGGRFEDGSSNEGSLLGFQYGGDRAVGPGVSSELPEAAADFRSRALDMV
jgi:hypothetical protein